MSCSCQKRKTIIERLLNISGDTLLEDNRKGMEAMWRLRNLSRLLWWEKGVQPYMTRTRVSHGSESRVQCGGLHLVPPLAKLS